MCFVFIIHEDLFKVFNYIEPLEVFPEKTGRDICWFIFRFFPFYLVTAYVEYFC